MSLCQVEQRKLPQLQAATSVAVLALRHHIPLDLLALFLRRHNQREKNSAVDCSYCVQGASAASVWSEASDCCWGTDSDSDGNWIINAGSQRVLQGSGCSSLTWTQGSRSFPGRHQRQLFSGMCLWTTHLDTSPSPDTSRLSGVQVRRPSGACRRTEPDIWGQRRTWNTKKLFTKQQNDSISPYLLCKVSWVNQRLKWTIVIYVMKAGSPNLLWSSSSRIKPTLSELLQLIY